MQFTQTQEEMECPICYDEINAQTGVVTTSCGHSYHFSCITHWYAKQEVASCPCCRKEPGEKEKLPEIQYEDDSDDEEEEEVEFTRAELDAFLRARGGGLTDALARDVCETICALSLSELNMLMICNCGRALTEDEWNELIYEEDEEDEEEDDGINHNGLLALASVSADLLMNDRNEGAEQDANDEASGVFIHSFFAEGNWLRIIGGQALEKLSEIEIKAAIKIQSSWRGFKLRRLQHA